MQTRAGAQQAEVGKPHSFPRSFPLVATHSAAESVQALYGVRISLGSSCCSGLDEFHWVI